MDRPVTADDAQGADLRTELLLKFRSRLEELPPAEFTVPADVVKRKSPFYAIEADGYLDRESAFALIRDAIDAALDGAKDAKAK